MRCVRGWRAYVEDGLGFPSRRLVVFLGVGNKLLGQTLGLFGLWPRCVQCLVADERRDETAEEGLPGRRLAAQSPVFHVSTGHFCGSLEARSLSDSFSGSIAVGIGGES